MIRIVVFLIVVGAVALGAAWLAEPVKMIWPSVKMIWPW